MKVEIRIVGEPGTGKTQLGWYIERVLRDIGIQVINKDDVSCDSGTPAICLQVLKLISARLTVVIKTECKRP